MWLVRQSRNHDKGSVLIKCSGLRRTESKSSCNLQLMFILDTADQETKRTVLNDKTESSLTMKFSSSILCLGWYCKWEGSKAMGSEMAGRENWKLTVASSRSSIFPLMDSSPFQDVG